LEVSLWQGRDGVWVRFWDRETKMGRMKRMKKMKMKMKMEMEKSTRTV